MGSTPAFRLGRLPPGLFLLRSVEEYLNPALELSLLNRESLE